MNVTSAEIYSMICDMMFDFLKTKFRFDYGETALNMYAYAACGYYPQDNEWYRTHGITQNMIQCTP
jgi:hypothetical protein